MTDLPGLPEQPDLALKDAAILAACSVDLLRREWKRGRLKLYRRAGRLYVRETDFCQWLYGAPAAPPPAERIIEFDDTPRRSRRAPARGSVTALRDIERGAA